MISKIAAIDFQQNYRIVCTSSKNSENMRQNPWDFSVLG